MGNKVLSLPIDDHVFPFPPVRVFLLPVYTSLESYHMYNYCLL